MTFTYYILSMFTGRADIHAIQNLPLHGDMTITQKSNVKCLHQYMASNSKYIRGECPHLINVCELPHPTNKWKWVCPSLKNLLWSFNGQEKNSVTSEMIGKVSHHSHHPQHIRFCFQFDQRVYITVQWSNGYFPYHLQCQHHCSK